MNTVTIEKRLLQNTILHMNKYKVLLIQNMHRTDTTDKQYFDLLMQLSDANLTIAECESALAERNKLES